MPSRVGASTVRGRQSMFTRRSLPFVIPVVLVLSAAAAPAADGPGLGQPISEAELALWNITIGPDGAGLPPGSGTPAQGAAIYAQKCELCHGTGGQGGR